MHIHFNSCPSGSPAQDPVGLHELELHLLRCGELMSAAQKVHVSIFKGLSSRPLVWALTFFKGSELWAPILKVVYDGVKMGS